MSEEVKDFIAREKNIPTKDELLKLLSEGYAEVTFNKLDGDVRVMTCTLLKEVVPAPKAEDPLSQKKVRTINENVIVVWDINAQGWRSFRYDRLIKVEGILK